MFKKFHDRPIREDGGARDVGGLRTYYDEPRIGRLVKSGEVCECIANLRDHSSDDVCEVWHRCDERFVFHVISIFLSDEDACPFIRCHDVIGIYHHVIVFQVERKQYGVRSFQVAPHHVRHAEAIFSRNMNLMEEEILHRLPVEAGRVVPIPVLEVRKSVPAVPKVKAVDVCLVQVCAPSQHSLPREELHLHRLVRRVRHSDRSRHLCVSRRQ